MGRGDRKTRKGKTFRGSYGKSRPRKKEEATATIAEEPEAKTEAAPKPPTAAKKKK